MAADVTMKDLQSLQGYVNKQDADLRKQIDALAKDVEWQKKVIDANEKVVEAKYQNWGIGDMKDRLTALETSVKALQATLKNLTDLVGKSTGG